MISSLQQASTIFLILALCNWSSSLARATTGSKQIPTDNLESLDAELLALDEEFGKLYARNFYEMIYQADEIATKEPSLALYSIAWNHLKYAFNNYVVQRRMIVGLKVNFARQFQKSGAHHLKALLANSQLPVVSSSKVNLRKNFPGITDEELVSMIYLIEVRARYRSLDDILALSTANIKRIHQMAEAYAFDKSKIYSKNIAHWSLVILKDYYQNALDYQDLLARSMEHALEELSYSLSSSTDDESNSSKQQNGGGGGGDDDDDDDDEEELRHKEAIVDKIDSIINDALDIQLSHEAQKLDLPPTINENMINNLMLAWLPKDVIRDQKRVLNVLIEAGLESKDAREREELARQLSSVDISPEATVGLIERLESQIV